MTCPDPGFDEVRDRPEDTPSGFGRLTAVPHAACHDGYAAALGSGQPFRSARMRRVGRSKWDPCGVSGIGMHNITRAGSHRGATAWAGSGRTVTR
jgi:hypothetical protein